MHTLFVAILFSSSYISLMHLITYVKQRILCQTQLYTNIYEGCSLFCMCIFIPLKIQCTSDTAMLIYCSDLLLIFSS